MQTIALISHDKKKDELLTWAKENQDRLKKFKLIGTSSTAALINNVLDLEVEPFGHGPFGGDVLMAAKVLNGEVERVIFFVDAESAHPHEHDIQTLIRIAVVNNVPIALNLASAEYIIREQEPVLSRTGKP
jgi:methylglyoxal synthase